MKRLIVTGILVGVLGFGCTSVAPTTTASVPSRFQVIHREYIPAFEGFRQYTAVVKYVPTGDCFLVTGFTYGVVVPKEMCEE